MKNYVVIEEFTDGQDNDYKYLVGDVFPHKGFTVSEERLEELSTNKNKRGFPMLKVVEVSEPEPKAETETAKESNAVYFPFEPEKAETETEKPVTKAPAKRGRRKNDSR